MFVVGVDACRGGWLAVKLAAAGDAELYVYRGMAELWQACRDAALILVDIPIGLLKGGPDERLCDLAARQILGPRKSSIFPAPRRGLVELPDLPYQEANARHREVAGGKGISRQSHALIPKIREVDRLLRREAATPQVIREVHPEVCFWSLAGGRPMQSNKKEDSGFAERRKVLKTAYPPADRIISEGLQWLQGKGVGRDDLLDALAAAITAFLGMGRLATLPVHPERDAHGLPMEMVYFIPGT